MQFFRYTLPTQTITGAATAGSAIINLNQLPDRLMGRYAHLVSLEFDVSLTPTHTTAPTVVGGNNLFTACDFTDGSVTRFQGGFNHMRAKERLACGRVRQPDMDTDTASGTARYWGRTLHLGPTHFRGAPADWAYPIGALDQGEVRITTGVLTAISADTTAYTASVGVHAVIGVWDELKVPPCYVFQNYSATGGDITLQGRALYESVSLLDSSAFGVFAAGEVANVNLDLGYGDVVRRVDARALGRAYQSDFAAGEIGGFMGDIRGASDDDMKMINRGTPTAAVGASNDLQPVLWASPVGGGAKLSKCFEAGGAARLTWDGTQATAIVLVGKVLPQSQQTLATIATKALRKFGKVPRSMEPKTLSKRPYKGPLTDYFPHVVKF